MSDHRYEIRISESCVDPNPIIAERQVPDNFTRFQTRERCALEIAAYVFNALADIHYVLSETKCLKIGLSLYLRLLFVYAGTEVSGVSARLHWLV